MLAQPTPSTQPYRARPDANAAPVVIAAGSVLGDLGRAAIAAGVAVAVGWMTAGLALGAALGAVRWALVALIGLDALKHIHRATIPRRLEGTVTTLRIVQPVDVRRRPWARRRDMTVAWTDVRAVTVDARESDVPVLCIALPFQTIAFESGALRGGAQAAATQLLDFRARAVEDTPALRQQRATRLRARVPQPIRFAPTPARLRLVVGVLATFVLILGVIAARQTGQLWILVATAPLALVFAVALLLSRDRRPTIVVNADALVLQWSGEAPVTLPWTDVVFVRPSVSIGGGQRTLTAITVGVADGRSIRLRGGYEPSIAALLGLLGD